MMGSSLPPRLMTAGLPTRHAMAVLFYFFGFPVPPREFSEDELTTEVLSAAFSFAYVSSCPGLRAFMTRSDRALLLLNGSETRGFRRHSSMPCSSNFRF